MDENKLITQRKQQLTAFVKKRYNWITYILLAIVIWIAVRIRTRNLPGLRDITTGGWTLGPDLDPFLFLRWAKQIVTTGSLAAIDTMRYVPIGFDTKRELILHPYLIAWFHNLATLFGSTSVEQSAALYPVFMFALTIIAFFLLTRTIFIAKLGPLYANAVAIVASFFLSVLPSLLPRTIAGIPEKESAAFFFLFASFYFFLTAWKAKKQPTRIIFAALAGAFTAGMALVWGGFIFIHVTLGLSVFLAFMFHQTNRDKIYVYGIWLIVASTIMMIFSTRYPLPSLLRSPTIGVAFFVLFILVVDAVLKNTKLRNYLTHRKLVKIPRPALSVIATILLVLVVGSVVFGPGFFIERTQNVVNTLVTPVTDRLDFTVAENRQPYFNEWSRSFGPIIQGHPLFFWLMFIGAIYLFVQMIHAFNTRERWALGGAYFLFLISIIFSRYAPGSTLNGTNATSLFVYFAGVIILLGTVGYYYYKRHREGRESILRNIDFGMILVFSFLFFSVIAARGAVRLIMMLIPPASIIVSYFVVRFSRNAFQQKREEALRLAAIVIAVILIIATAFAGYQLYLVSNATAQGFIPSAYNQQWQQSMSWVRENTAENAVFGHWWDYGYWIQSIGERATVLDGGNAVAYWNHLMGRHALTGPDERTALEFLYTHQTTHFLIDSTDIGKYTAFATIGSNENLDRRSWIGTFLRDDSQIFEGKNTTSFIYTGGFSLDEDVIYEDENGQQIFLPGVSHTSIQPTGPVAGVGAVRLNIDTSTGELLQPVGIFIYQGQQYELPLRYLATEENGLVDFGTGVESGIFLFPRVSQNGGNMEVHPNGAMLYLSARTVNSQLARLYLYGQETDAFTLAHVQDDVVVQNVRGQVPGVQDFLFFQGIRGPIKIWEITYPDDIETQEEYLETTYPDELRLIQ